MTRFGLHGETVACSNDASAALRQPPSGHSTNPIFAAELDVVVTDYLETLRAGGRAGSTLRNYSLRLNRLVDFLAGRRITAVTQVREADLIAFFVHLSTVQKLRASSRLAYFPPVRGLFAYAMRRRIIGDDPSAHLPRPRPTRDLPIVLNHEEIAALFLSCDAETVGGLRDRAILSLAFGTGCRLGELRRIRKQHVSQDGETPPILYIGPGKTRTARQIPIPSFAVYALAAYWRARPDRDVPWAFVNPRTLEPLSARGIQYAFTAACRRAKLPPISPHTARHTFATLAVEAHPLHLVQAWLGQASPATTARYIQVSGRALRELAGPTNPLEVALNRALRPDRRTPRARGPPV